MPHSPTVTVIMPAHNGARFIAAAIDSVLAQTFDDFALIVVDDASTDETAAIVSRYDDRRLSMVREPSRLGAAGARNRALDLVRSPYVAFLDCDDVAHPRRLQTQLSCFRRRADRVRFVASRVAIVDEMGRPTGDIWGHAGASEAIAGTMLFTNCIALSSVLVERALIADERFDGTLNAVEDFDLWTRLLDRLDNLEGGRIVCLPEPLVHYRVHSASLTHTSAATMEEPLRQIAAARLARLGLTPSTAELDLHRALGSGRIEGTTSFLTAVAEWLQKLQSSNAAAKVYDVRAFRSVLAHQWLRVCDAAARGGAWGAWPHILRSRMTARLLADSSSRSELRRLPWRTARGFVRRRWPHAGPALRAGVWGGAPR
jgi:hypothetical protein